MGKELRLLSDIFHGLKRVEENFNVIQSRLSETKDIPITLIPDPPWEEIDHINLQVDKGDFHIHMVEIHNTIGGITRFTLGDLSIQKKLRDTFFQFKVPEGVKVIKDGE